MDTPRQIVLILIWILPKIRQIHQKNKNLGERFVFVEDRGAIAFMATVGLSGLPALDVFAERFYRKLAVDNYGQGIGDVTKAVIQELENQGVGVSNRIVYHQMTLNGDPSIRLNTSPAPDFVVKRPSIAFEPTNPDANDDFELTFTVTNIGRSTSDPFRLLIERVLPTGVEIAVVDEMVDSPSFEQEYTYRKRLGWSQSIQNHGRCRTEHRRNARPRCRR